VVSVHLKLGISYHIHAKEALVEKTKQNTASIEPPYNVHCMRSINVLLKRERGEIHLIPDMRFPAIREVSRTCIGQVESKTRLGDGPGRVKRLMFIALQALPMIAPTFTLIHKDAHEAPREVACDQGTVQINVAVAT
jgi:hypothetical protein